MKKLIAFLVMLCTFLVVAGCGGNTGSGDTGAKNGAVKGNAFKDAGVAVKIMDELKAKKELKGQDLQVFQNFSMVKLDDPNGPLITIHLLKPGTTDKVDSYFYGMGKWGDAEPVQLTGDGDMKDNIAPLSSIDFAKLPDMYKTLEKKAKEIEGGKVGDEVHFTYDYDTHQYTIWVQVKGAREIYDAYFDAKGNLKDYIKK